ncbi:DUF1177 domain-containing protein [Brevibacterium permense]|uniref:DUF1177 domain-containing protein n=1 Tax=Brevibacterium permense TaxID=234834 RepID=A0ABN2AGI7_9MICO
MKAAVESSGPAAVTVETVTSDKGTTDFVRILVQGKSGKSRGGSAPTLGVIGRLGGLGARPTRVGFTSDGDGAAVAVSTALKLSAMASAGDVLDGDVIIATHICPDAPTRPHKPVEFMDSPVDINVMNQHEVTDEMDAILSIDTTKGNRLVNVSGFAITPAILDGYVLRVPDDLVDIMEVSTGKPCVTFPITNQDITPYGNGVYHVNSIVQPATAAKVPVVGVAITTESAVPGSATGASHEIDVAEASRFTIEVAKAFGKHDARFVDQDEVDTLRNLYGSLAHLYQSAEQ